MIAADVSSRDVWLLARTLNQYEIQPAEQARLVEAFPEIAFNGDAENNAKLVLEYLDQQSSLGKLVFAVDPDTPPAGDSVFWQWRSFADAFKPRPPREYIVEGLLPLPSLSLVFGPPASFKTLWLQDLAVCVATGRDRCLEALPDGPASASAFRCHQGQVLWVDVDNGDDRTSRRFEAIGKAYKVQDPATVSLAYVSFPDPPFLANSDAAVASIIEQALLFNAKLIAFDNLGTISGTADENSSQMIKVMLGLRKIAEATGAAVVVIHHPNKAQEHLRGHTSIQAAVDLALQVRREPDEDIVSIKSVKSRDKPLAPFTAVFSYDNDETGELAAARFYGMGAPAKALSVVEQAKLCIQRDLKGRLNQSQLADLVKENAGIGRNNALKAIKMLVEEGALSMQEVGGAKLYFNS